MVYTDNNPFAHYQNTKNAVMEIRWITQLEKFDIDIKYRPDRENENADAFSRMSQYLTASTGLPNNLNPQHTARVDIIRKPIEKQLPNIDSTGLFL